MGNHRDHGEHGGKEINTAGSSSRQENAANYPIQYLKSTFLLRALRVLRGYDLEYPDAMLSIGKGEVVLTGRLFIFGWQPTLRLRYQTIEAG